MDERHLTNLAEDSVRDEGQAVGETRRRAKEFLSAQQSRLERLEADITARLQHVAEELALEQALAQERDVDWRQKSSDVEERAAALNRARQQWTDEKHVWERHQEEVSTRQQAVADQLRKQQQDLEEREAKLEQIESGLRQQERAMEMAQKELAGEREMLSALRERIESQRHELEAERDAVAAQLSETANQRRRIAREFKAQHAAHLEELERRREKLESLAASSHDELEGQVASLSIDTEKLRRQIAAVEESDQRHRQEAEQLRGELKAVATENEKLRGEQDKLTQQFAVEESLAGGVREQIESLRAQRDALAARLTAAESVAAGGGDSAQQELADLQKRYDMAVADVRDLKRTNSELELKLSKVRSPGPGAETSSRLDWEAQKKRLLATLEEDATDDAKNEHGDERLTIENTIRHTDAVVDEKDREIAELRQMLEEQACNLGSVAVGAAAVADLFDSSELIQQEQQRLKELQNQWEEKLRTAEVDLSLERAKVAREGAELDEKIQQLQRLQSHQPQGNSSDSAGKSAKPGRGRWLTRLGLKDTD